MPKSRPIAYDPLTGVFTRPDSGNTVGTVNGDGYVVLKYEGRLVYGHRLAWRLMTGDWPKLKIDHRDRVRHNNVWTNLRAATSKTNAENRLGSVAGAHFHKPSGRFKSAICVDGQQIHLGYFENGAAASAAYMTAKRELHEGFAHA